MKRLNKRRHSNMIVSLKTAKLFLEGDEAAACEVYQNYKALLYFIISTYLKRKEDCDDVYQDVFLKLLSKRNEIREASSLHQYLCTMAKNEALDFIRKNNKAELKDDIDCLVIQEKDSPLDYFLPYDLAKEEKSIVGYKVTFGLSWKDISSILNMPIPTAKKKYAQAMKKIKEVYKK